MLRPFNIGTKKTKIGFDLALHKIKDLAPEVNGRAVRLYWKYHRRNRFNTSAQSSIVLVQKSEAEWRHENTFSVIAVIQEEKSPLGQSIKMDGTLKVTLCEVFNFSGLLRN